MRLLIFLILLLPWLMSAADSAYALDFNAYWLYSASGSEEGDTVTQFQERYSLGAGPAMTYRPTHALSFSAGVGYNRTQRDSGQGTITETEINPSAAVSLINDIYLAQAAAQVSRVQIDDEDDETEKTDEYTHYWDVTLASRWDLPLWPSLRLNYGKRDAATDHGDLLDFSDIVTTYRTVSLDWDLWLAQLVYRYSDTTTEDQENGSVSEGETHFAQLETSGSLLKNRLRYNLSQQIQRSDSTFVVGELDSNGFFARKLEGASLGKVDSLADPAPGEIGYSEPSVAIGLPSLDIGAGQRAHLYFGDRLGFPRSIDVVRLRFDQFSEQAAGLQWSLYLRDFTGNTWNLAEDNIQGQYNPGAGYVEIPVGRTVNELLLVAVNSSGAPLALNRLEAFQLLVGSSSNNSWNYVTNVGVQVALTKTIAASTSALFERQESDAGEKPTEAERRTLNAELRWAMRPWMTYSLGYNENRTTDSSSPEKFNRSRSLNVSTLPLPPVRLNFGVEQGERYISGDKTDAYINYSLMADTRIYPDLYAKLYLSWLENERLVDGLDDEFENSKNFGSRLQMTAWLRRTLVADWISQYNTYKDEDRNAENASTTLSLNYQPSTLLAMRGFYTAYLLGSTQTDILGAGVTLALLYTDRARLELDYSLSQQDETLQSIGMRGFWNISQALSLQTRATYSMSEIDSYTFQAFLNLRL